LLKGKFILSILISFFILTACSFLKDKLEELTSEGSEENGTTSVEDLSNDDREFIFKYVEEINNLSSQVDGLQNSYLESVPDPETIKNTSMIFVITPTLNYSFLERKVKELKRSFYDGGDLAKLKTGNKKMKAEFENSFDELLISTEEYMDIADEVISFYKNGEYRNNLSEALKLDRLIRNEYEHFSDRMELMKETINRFKPIVINRDPEEEKGNKRLYIILENSYTEIMDKAEMIYDKVYNLNEGDKDNSVSIALNEFESALIANRNKIDKENFPESIKFLKYNFEDYFSKTSYNLIDSGKEFITVMNSGSRHKREFNLKQDAVLRNYNYLVRSYNTSLNVISQYRNLNL
jgi:hypothetical protein